MKKMSFAVVLLAAALFAFIAAPVMAQQAEKPAAPAAEKAAKPAKPAKPAVTGKININTATAEQLEMLPGIGAKKAAAIVDYRAKNGNFKKIDDLLKVPGIKQKKIDKCKDYIIFEGETTLKQTAPAAQAK